MQTSWIHTAGLGESSWSKSKTELPVSKLMTLLSSDSSFVQLAVWPFTNHAFLSSADNLQEIDTANWMTSKLYNARVIHWKAAATINEITNHIHTCRPHITDCNVWASSQPHEKEQRMLCNNAHFPDQSVECANLKTELFFCHIGQFWLQALPDAQYPHIQPNRFPVDFQDTF